MSIKVKEQSELTDEELNYVAFFDFWNKIDIVKTYTPDEHHELFGSSYRWQIVDVLAIGIEDECPGSGLRIRHALTGKEIMEMIEKKHGKTISKSNLYFHLNALIEGGAVTEVGTVASGKRFTSYYGRTAKGFLTIKTAKDIHPIIYKDYFKDIIRKLNPEITDDDINRILNKLKPLTSYDDSIFADWVEKYQNIIFDAELDVRYLANFGSVLYRYNLKVGEGLNELSKLLKIEKIENGPRDIEGLGVGSKPRFSELSEHDKFAYWNQLPPVRVFPNHAYKSIFDHTNSKQTDSVYIRMAIITILKEGRKEQNPETDRVEQRNLMMASEIIEDIDKFAKEYKKEIEMDVKPSALYFHLDKLEKHGLIQAVGYVTQGRKRITYYGRTAKYYTYNERMSEEDTYPILKSEGLKELVLRLEREVTKNDYDQNIELLLGLNKYDPLALPIWLRETKVEIDDIKVEVDNEELRNVDLVEISTLISICQRFTPDATRALNTLANWLKFPQAE